MLLAATAEPDIYIFGGLFLMIGGLAVALDYKGIAAPYIRFVAKNLSDESVRRYRMYYGFVAVFGLAVFVAGVI